MPVIEDHGGDCCGVKHVYGFVRPDQHDAVESLDRVLEAVCPADNPNRLSEVVLTDDQMEEGWGPILRARGFRLVVRWRNSNSDNVCNMFVMVPTELSMEDADLPWSWEDEAAPALEAAPADGYRRVEPQRPLRVGDTVRVVSRNYRYLEFGSIHTITLIEDVRGETLVTTDITGARPAHLGGRQAYSHRFELVEPVAPEQFVDVESVIFVNIYRNGPSAIEHPSLEAANAARNADRRVRCEERRTLSNGVVEVINHV